MAQAITGEQSSTPKLMKVLAQDSGNKLYKQMGNGHNKLYFWGETVTVVSGTTVVVASGVSYHGKELATYANVVATPLASLGSANYYVSKDTTNNIISIVASSTLVDVSFDVQMVLS